MIYALHSLSLSLSLSLCYLPMRILSHLRWCLSLCNGEDVPVDTIRNRVDRALKYSHLLLMSVLVGVGGQIWVPETLVRRANSRAPEKEVGWIQQPL